MYPRQARAVLWVQAIFGTDAEVLKLCSDVKWNCGIKIFEEDLCYEGDPEANCIQLKFPELPEAAAYVSERASRLGLANNDEAGVTSVDYLSGAWRFGANWMEADGKMRQGFGENRPLQTVRAHFFRREELLDLKPFLLPCFVFGSGAYLIQKGRND